MIFNVFRMNMDESSSILCHTDGSRAKFSHQKLAASRVVVLPVVVERSMELSKRDLWSFLDGHWWAHEDFHGFPRHGLGVSDNFKTYSLRTLTISDHPGNGILGDPIWSRAQPFWRQDTRLVCSTNSRTVHAIWCWFDMVWQFDITPLAKG